MSCEDCKSITLFKGTDGRTIYNGIGAPGVIEGANGGDFYIDTDNWEIYGPYDGSSWGTGTSLIGADGVYGGWSSEWDFDDAITSGTANEQFRFDNADPSAAETLYVNKINGDSTDLTAFLTAWQNSGNFGLVRISKKDDANIFWMGVINDAAFSATEGQFPVSTVLSNGTFTDGDAFIISYVRNGAAGTPGSPGSPGSPGTPGQDGSVWTSAAGAPVGAGVNAGDQYLNTTNGDVYEWDGATWNLTGNIQGPSGGGGALTFKVVDVPSGGSANTNVSFVVDSENTARPNSTYYVKDLDNGIVQNVILQVPFDGTSNGGNVPVVGDVIEIIMGVQDDWNIQINSTNANCFVGMYFPNGGLPAGYNEVSNLQSFKWLTTTNNIAGASVRLRCVEAGATVRWIVERQSWDMVVNLPAII